MTDKNEKHAIVLSGGGADGAYEIGVLKALLNGRSPTTHYEAIDPEIFTGTSIGSFNAAFLVSQWDDYGPSAIGNLERVWLERLAANARGNGGFRLRLNPLDLLNPLRYVPNPLRPLAEWADDTVFLANDLSSRVANLFTSKGSRLEAVIELFNLSSAVSTDPWDELIRETIDYAKIRGSSRELLIAATNWAKGEVTIFENRDMSEVRGPEAVRASSSIPGFYPTATVGSQPFIDGGVLLNTPLKPAIKAGATVIHIIYLNPQVENIPITKIESTLDTLYRTQLIAWASAVNRDIEQAHAYNLVQQMMERGRKLRESKAEEELGVSEKEARQFLKVAHRLEEKIREGKKVKPLTIHCYAPEDMLGGVLGLLDVRRQRIEELVDRGFEDAVNHEVDDSRYPTEDRQKARKAIQERHQIHPRD